MSEKFENATQLRQTIKSLDKAEEREVLSRPFKWQEPTDDLNVSEEHQGVWNLGTGKLACIASKRYKIIQHTDALQQLSEVLTTLNINCSGKVINERDRVTAEILFKDLHIDDGKLGIQLGVRIINSYDCSRSLGGELIAFRKVCTNGMIVGRATGISFKRTHIGNLDARAEMREFLKKAINGTEALKKFVSEAMAETLEWDLARRVLMKLIKVKSLRELIIKNLEETEGKMTRWDLYNAITNVATHGEDISSNAFEYLQRKAQDVLVEMPNPATDEEMVAITIRETRKAKA